MYDKAKHAVVTKEEDLKQCSHEIREVSGHKDKLSKSVTDASLEARKVQHRLTQWEKDFQEASKAMSSLVKKNTWISKEKDYFGVAGTAYDFDGRNASESKARLKELNAAQVSSIN